MSTTSLAAHAVLYAIAVIMVTASVAITAKAVNENVTEAGLPWRLDEYARIAVTVGVLLGTVGILIGVATYFV